LGDTVTWGSLFSRATACNAIMRIYHHNSVHPSVSLSVCQTGGSVKNDGSSGQQIFTVTALED